jgi:hypothetical protein
MVMGDISGTFCSFFFLTFKRLESEFKQGGREIFFSSFLFFPFLGHDDVRLMSVSLEILETVFPFFFFPRFLCISRDKSPFLLYHFFVVRDQGGVIY